MKLSVSDLTTVLGFSRATVASVYQEYAISAQTSVALENYGIARRITGN